MQIASLASICLCIGLWIRAKTIGEDERGNAERRLLFVERNQRGTPRVSRHDPAAARVRPRRRSDAFN
jgi:hypothetical protein